MLNTPVYQRIASLLLARENCRSSGNTEWLKRHSQDLLALVDTHLPSGSGFDTGTQISFDRSTPERLVFTTSYHHMDEGGYDGWTEHEVIVTPSLVHGIALRITGTNRNDIKDYIAECVEEGLRAVPETTR